MFLCHFGVFLLQFFFTFRKFDADDEFDERDYYKDCSQDQGDLGCSCVAAKVFKKKEQKRKEKEERKEKKRKKKRRKERKKEREREKESQCNASTSSQINVLECRMMMMIMV